MIKVLIVDDETNVLQKLPQIFERYFPDAQVDTAHSFEIAEKFLENKLYNIILLDGMLSDTIIEDHPEKGYGYNLIPIIREKSPLTTIIMISSNDEMNEKGVKMGADFERGKSLFFSGGKVINYLMKNFAVTNSEKLNPSDLIDKCSECKHLYWPNTPFRYTTGPICKIDHGHVPLEKDHYFKSIPSDCPQIGKDERYITSPLSSAAGFA